MIKVKIKHPGAHMMAGKELRELKVGEVLELQGDELPNFLIGKAEIICDNEGKSLVTSDELLVEADKQIAELTVKVSALESEKAELVAANADLTKELDKADAEIADLKKSKSGK